MPITRRELLKRAGSIAALGVLPTLSACAEEEKEKPKKPLSWLNGDEPSSSGLPVYSYSGPKGPEDTFADGIASGDPLADAVILWTRINPGKLGGKTIKGVLNIPLQERKLKIF